MRRRNPDTRRAARRPRLRPLAPPSPDLPTPPPAPSQAQCGSCWAFAATGAMEGAWFVATGSGRSFSEQQLIDCAWDEVGREGGSASGRRAPTHHRLLVSAPPLPPHAGRERLRRRRRAAGVCLHKQGGRHRADTGGRIGGSGGLGGLERAVAAWQGLVVMGGARTRRCARQSARCIGLIQTPLLKRS